MCVQVCAYMSQRLASLIKVAWTAQVLVIVVCLIRISRMDLLMKADCTAQYAQLRRWLSQSAHSKGHLNFPAFSWFDLFLLQITLDLSYF